MEWMIRTPKYIVGIMMIIGSIITIQDGYKLKLTTSFQKTSSLAYDTYK